MTRGRQGSARLGKSRRGSARPGAAWRGRYGPVRIALLLAAALATFYASAALITHFDADFDVSAVIAALCLGGVFALDYREAERRRYRAAVWERRDSNWNESGNYELRAAMEQARWDKR